MKNLGKNLGFIILGFAAILMAQKATGQQLFSYTQYMDNLVPVNSAYALMNKDGGTINTTLRRQWLGVNGAPTNYMMNVNFPINPIGGASGFILMKDQLGLETKIELSAFLAKNIELSEGHYLGISINGGFYSYKTQYAQLDPNDPAIQNDVSQLKPNAGFAMLYYTDKYYFGLSVPQITIQNLGQADLLENNNFRNNYYAAAGFSTSLGPDFKLKPSALVNYVRGVPVIADISGIMYMKDEFGLGLNYRTNGETAALFSLDINDLHIGYSYQFGTSALNVGGYSNATHEINLAIHFGRANRVPLPVQQ